ncbi:MAG TPA: hypothetical protein GXZ28_01010 [Clostridiales bacterium]|nr:hypothetical protein [Clostridiales bacterium]
MKIIGYLIFTFFYHTFWLFCRVKPKKVFAIMTHDESLDGNVGQVVDFLKEKEEGYRFHYLTKKDRQISGNIQGLKGIISFFVMKPYHLARSEVILMDNVFLPMAYMKMRKSVKVIQLWHGTGTIKKFGQDVNTGSLKKLEKRANHRITHLIVNSEETKRIYSRAFGIPLDKVYVLGLPRTDIFFSEEMIKERREQFFAQFPNLKNKRLLLYAPTFRDEESKQPKIALDTKLIGEELKDYALLLRLHPFVEEAYRREGESANRIDGSNIISMTGYPDINTLLLVSDYLITDYSSIIFDYCLQGKPMIFYAYDLEEFSNQGRGFYHPYEHLVPGPVVKNTEEIIELIKKDQFDLDRIEDFKRKQYRYLDGKSTERLYLHILKK